MNLSGGAFWFLLFLIVGLFAVAYAYYSRSGSDIGQRGWKDRDQVMGMGLGKDPSADVRTWSRGTSAPRRRRQTALEEQTAEAMSARANGGRDPAYRARTTKAVQLVAPVDPARDHIRGRNDAQVTLVEYGEYECRYCKEADQVVEALLARFGDDLRLVFRHVPQVSLHPNAMSAAVAAEAAARQGRFWEMHTLMARTKKQLDAPVVRELAKKSGLDLERFDADLADPVLRERVEEDLHSGIVSGVNGTPTFFLNNVRYDDDLQEKELGEAIEAARGVAVSAGASGID